MKIKWLTRHSVQRKRLLGERVQKRNHMNVQNKTIMETYHYEIECKILKTKISFTTFTRNN